MLNLLSKLEAVGAIWPLVGRTAEQDLILDAASARRHGGVVLAGSPGVGKTRLARDVTARVEAGGSRVEWVVATAANQDIPFGAFVHLLPDSDLPAAEPLDLLRRIERSLAAADGRPVLLAVDDAHLLDGPSAMLVHHVVLTKTAFVLATVRSGEPAADPIVRLWKDDLADRMELSPLSHDDIGELLATVLSGQVDGATIRHLWDSSAGNLVYLRELIAGGLSSGALACDRGLWSWQGPLVAPRLTELLEQRWRRLSAEVLNVVETTALAEPLELGLLGAVAGLANIDAAVNHGLLHIERDERGFRVRLTQPLYGEALRDQIPVVRAQIIFGRLADALQEAGLHRAGDHLTLVGWRVAAGEPVPAEDLTSAARAAHGRFDHGLAERLARRALEARDPSAATTTNAAIVLGAALDWQGRHDEASEVLSRVTPATDDEQVELANTLAPCLFYGLGRQQDAEDVLRRALDAVSDSDAQDSLNALWAQFLLFAGDPERALNVANTVLSRQDVDQRQRIRATAAAAPALAMLGRTTDARSIAEAVLPAAVQLGAQLPRAVGQLFGSLIVAACLAGDFTEAQRHSDALYQLAMSQQDHGVRAGAAAGLGYSALYSGRVRTACRWLREASGLLRAYDPTGYRILALAGLAHAAALAGEVDEAEAALREATGSWTVGAGAFDVQLALARAWSVVPSQGISAGRRLALDAADRAARLGQPAMELLALHDVARLRGAPEVATRIATVAANVDGRLAPIMAAHVVGLVEHNGDRLLQAADRFEQLGACLLAAEASASASHVLADAGLTRSARAAATRAATLGAMCEGARTPGLVPATPAGHLTERELEIASLAAQGLSNREIAERLVLSTRTIDNHLHRIYAKVGAGHRTELATLLNLDG